MDCHLKDDIFTSGRLMFIDCQEESKSRALNLYNKTSKNEESIIFWKNVKNFFDSTNVNDNKFKREKVPCSFVKDSRSVGRHRQHCYIVDNTGTSFQIDCLTHRNKLCTLDDSQNLGAIAEAMITQSPIGIDNWFEDFRNFTKNKVKNSLLGLLKHIEFLNVMNSQLKTIKEFHECFFFWNIYNFKRNKIEDYYYDGILDLENVFKLSAEISEKNIEEFKEEIKKLIS